MVGQSSDSFDPYYKWLGIPIEDQPPNHYRLLGLNLFESDVDVIENAADGRCRHLRSFQSGKRARESQRLINEVMKARTVLLDENKRAAYDRELRRERAARPSYPPAKETNPEQPPSFTTSSTTVGKEEPMRLAPPEVTRMSTSPLPRIDKQSKMPRVAGVPTVVVLLIAIGGTLVSLGLIALTVRQLSRASEFSVTDRSSGESSSRSSDHQSGSSRANGSTSEDNWFQQREPTWFGDDQVAPEGDSELPPIMPLNPTDVVAPFPEFLAESLIFLTFESVTRYEDPNREMVVVLDALGRNEHGLTNVDRFSSGYRAEGISFDGASTYLELSVPQLPILTVSMRLRYQHFREFAQLIAGNTDNMGYTINIKRDQPSNFSLMTGDGRQWRGTPFQHGIPDQEWHHVLFCFDTRAREMRLHVDGEMTAQVSFARTVVSSDHPIVISTKFEDNAFKGDVDDVAVFDRALSEHEIRALAELSR